MKNCKNVFEKVKIKNLLEQITLWCHLTEWDEHRQWLLLVLIDLEAVLVLLHVGVHLDADTLRQRS